MHTHYIPWHEPQTLTSTDHLGQQLCNNYAECKSKIPKQSETGSQEPTRKSDCPKAAATTTKVAGRGNRRYTALKCALRSTLKSTRCSSDSRTTVLVRAVHPWAGPTLAARAQLLPKSMAHRLQVEMVGERRGGEEIKKGYSQANWPSHLGHTHTCRMIVY